MKRATAKSRKYVLPIIVLAIFISASGILLARAFYYNEPGRKISGPNPALETTFSLAPGRGSIYDRNHRELAVNATTYSVYAHPLNIDDPDRTAAILSDRLRIDEKHLLDLLKYERAFVWIKRDLTFEQVEMVRDLNLKGIHFIAENHRVYPQSNLAAQVIGFTNSDGHGVEGLELAYDSLLCGIPLLLDGGSNRLTQPISEEEGAGVNKNKGNNLILTLDRNVQSRAERELRAVSKKGLVKAGTVIAMNIEDGAILAMANYPFYDPNIFWETKAPLRRNLAVTDTYKLGDLLDFFTEVAAWEEQFIHKKAIPTVEKADNSRRGIDISEHPSPEFLYNFLLNLGLGRKTGIGLPAENTGTLPLPKVNVYDQRVEAIYKGEGISATPLQIITAFGAILNRGLLMQPRLLMKVTDNQGNLIREHPAVAVRQVCRPETSEKIHAKLISNQARPSPKGKDFIPLAAFNYIRIRTINDSSQEELSLDKSHQTDYIECVLGCLPADNPKVAVLMLVEGICEEGLEARIEHSMENVAHAALKTLRDSQARMFIATDKEKRRPVCTKGSSDRGNRGLSGVNIPRLAIMPDVRGKCMREVLCMLQGYDLCLVIKGSGVAVSQFPAPGEKIGKKIRCVVEFRPPPW